MEKRMFFCRMLLISFFICFSNLWGMSVNAQLKQNLGLLAQNLKELKVKNKLLVTKLILLKDKLEGTAES
jgi:hypothetical protein